MEAVFDRHIEDATERCRFRSVRDAFTELRPYLRGRVLDFGASYGLSMMVLLQLGATDVDGVEVDPVRVVLGRRMLAEVGGDPNRLVHVPDTRRLPFPAAAFDTVIANAVFEHIPPPRRAYLAEVWRVVAPGGHLIIAETPNKYLPFDFHTTQLWWVPWLPSRLARAYAVCRGRFRPDQDWASSGWRGVGYYEIIRAFGTRYTVIEETTRLRQRLLARLGLPAALLDPYPLLIIRKH